MNKSKIAILTTVVNVELYKKSSLTFPGEIQQYIIDGRNGMHGIHSIFFMMEKLKKINIEWLIMADEDVFFKKAELVFEIIDQMIKRNFDVAGIRDGGVINHRIYNPYFVNTFFVILNLKEIKAIWNRKEVLKNNVFYKNEFNDDFMKLKFKFDEDSFYEPYYSFFLWLRRKGKKFLFLDSNQPIEDDLYYKCCLL